MRIASVECLEVTDKELLGYVINMGTSWDVYRVNIEEQLLFWVTTTGTKEQAIRELREAVRQFRVVRNA